MQPKRSPRSFTATRKWSILTLLLIFLSQSSESKALLIQVQFSEFGPSSRFESFEGVVPGPNVQDLGGGNLLPGTIAPYVFSTGLSLTSPIPNTNLGAALDQKVTVRTGGFGLGIYDDNVPTTAPFGNVFLIHGGGLDDPFELTFPEPVQRVGGFWIIGGFNPATDRIFIEAFDENNTSLGTVFAPPSFVEDWGSNFFGFQDDNLTPISRIAIDNGPGGNPSHPGVDGLMFELFPAPSNPIPEPSTMLLLGSGLVGLGYFRRRRKLSRDDLL